LISNKLKAGAALMAATAALVCEAAAAAGFEPAGMPGGVGPAMDSGLWPGAPMSRDGSGTSWLPDSSPLAMFHGAWGASEYMAHGAAYVRYTNQDLAGAGSRGGEMLDAPNMFMFGLSRPAASGRFLGRAMLSLDPLTEGGDGYPLLFQTGESWEGRRLVDRQHPHDLLGEFAVGYGRGFAANAGAFGYLGYPGEPALGPPVYLHRPSSWYNPDAPLGHHAEDSTHVAWGVATAGVYWRGLKLDGSTFTGREPDEDRYVPDRPRFDSWSARLSWNPTARWAGQVSYGFLKAPEELEPDHDVFRATASAIYTAALSDGYFAAAAVWGNNTPSRRGDRGRGAGAWLLDATYGKGRFAPYTRLELLARTPEELALEGFAEDARFNVGAATLGVASRLVSFGGADLAAGVQGTAYAVPLALRPAYGERPFSAEVFFRLSPSLMIMAHTPAEGPEGMEHMPH